MFRGSLVPPEVFTAHAKKLSAARMEAMRNRLKLGKTMGNAGSRPDSKVPPAGRPVALVGRPR